jgi:hypothetical protein
MPQEIIHTTISKGWYKMASSDDKRRVEETKCSRGIWYESDFWEPAILEAPAVAWNYTEPPDPQEFHGLRGVITSICTNMKYLYNKSTQNLCIPKRMSTCALFP